MHRLLLVSWRFWVSTWQGIYLCWNITRHLILGRIGCLWYLFWSVRFRLLLWSFWCRFISARSILRIILLGSIVRLESGGCVRLFIFSIWIKLRKPERNSAFRGRTLFIVMKMSDDKYECDHSIILLIGFLMSEVINNEKIKYIHLTSYIFWGNWLSLLFFGTNPVVVADRGRQEMKPYWRYFNLRLNYFFFCGFLLGFSRRVSCFRFGCGRVRVFCVRNLGMEFLLKFFFVQGNSTFYLLCNLFYLTLLVLFCWLWLWFLLSRGEAQKFWREIGLGLTHDPHVLFNFFSRVYFKFLRVFELLPWLSSFSVWICAIYEFWVGSVGFETPGANAHGSSSPEFPPWTSFWQTCRGWGGVWSPFPNLRRSWWDCWRL